MKRLAPLVLVFVACVMQPACERKLPAETATILGKADKIEVYSLDPKRTDEKPKDNFHGWKVLGKTTLAKKEDREKLLQALKKGIADSDGAAAGCFNPRHGLKATHDGKTVELVICFECLSMQIYLGDKKSSEVLTTSSPQPVFDKVLKDAGVPLAKKAE